ncbi:MAG: hypothetical protein WA584_05915 [Pyrinomonadaceae bacterium]
MNQFESARKNITEDVNEIYSAIWEEIKHNYFSTSNSDLTSTRIALIENIPKLMKSRNLLLLDTVYNYVSDDAVKMLDNSDSKTVNSFYENDRYWAESLRNDFQQSLDIRQLSLTSDNRTIYAGGSGLVTGGVTGIVVKALWDTVPLALLASVAAGAITSAVVYQRTFSIVKNQIEENTKQYIENSKAATLQNLIKLIDGYQTYFNNFIKEQINR